MSSTAKPLIVVTGATGAQGGSVVMFLLKDGGFRIRAITRNVESPKAKDLAAKGVEVFKASFDEPATIAAAFAGAYGVYGVTNFWELGEGGMDKETAQGKVLVDAAKKAGIKHFVWSTLDHTDDPEVDHWISKARVDDYLKESGVPRTSLYTAFYYENFMTFMPVTKADDGTLEAKWPMLVSDGPIGAYAAADTGAFVLESFKNPKEWVGKDMRVQTEVIKPRQLVKLLEEVTGKSIKLHEVSYEAFDGIKGVPGLHELWANMKWFYKFDGIPNRDMELTRRIYPDVQTFHAWVKENIDAIVPK